MVAGFVAELRAAVAAQDGLAAQENALRAFAEALDTVATETAGPAFSASLFGCHGRSYAPRAKRIADEELARVFKSTRLQQVGRGGG